MDTDVKILRCGECGEREHHLYTMNDGSIVVECVKCGSQSKFEVPQPTIRIENHNGKGTLCHF